MTDKDRFASLTRDDQRRYMAQALGCNPSIPGGWPDSLVDRMVDVRLREGTAAYYRMLGTLLSAHT